MKKDYIRLTAIITSLILLAFVIIEGLYTYVTATKIMNEKMALAENHALKLSSIERVDNTDNIIHKAYYEFKLQSQYCRNDDIGFYGMIKLDDGKVVESGDFVEVMSVPYDNSNKFDYRYFPVSSDFKGDIEYIAGITTVDEDMRIFGL